MRGSSCQPDYKFYVSTTSIKRIISMMISVFKDCEGSRHQAALRWAPL